MAALEHRAATLDLSEGCARCGVAVGEAPPAIAGISGGSVPQFYLFPSGNAFHGTCLANEVMQLVPPPQQQRIHTLLTRLSQVLHLAVAPTTAALNPLTSLTWLWPHHSSSASMPSSHACTCQVSIDKSDTLRPTLGHCLSVLNSCI